MGTYVPTASILPPLNFSSSTVPRLPLRNPRQPLSFSPTGSILELQLELNAPPPNSAPSTCTRRNPQTAGPPLGSYLYVLHNIGIQHTRKFPEPRQRPLTPNIQTASQNRGIHVTPSPSLPLYPKYQPVKHARHLNLCPLDKGSSPPLLTFSPLLAFSSLSSPPPPPPLSYLPSPLRPETTPIQTRQ